MFSIRFVKVPPTTYVIQFRSGTVVRANLATDAARPAT